MLAYLFLAFGIAMRFLPHPFHFTPVGAALLFFGAKRPARELWVPIVLLIASDIALNVFVYRWEVDWLTFTTSIYYLLAVLIGSLLKDKETVARIAGASLAGSLVFFAVSNFTTWLGTNMYARTWDGLVACFVAAIPFFRNTVIGDLLFTGAMFLTPVAIAALQRRRAFARVH
jgi:hypothetical protein